MQRDRIPPTAGCSLKGYSNRYWDECERLDARRRQVDAGHMESMRKLTDEELAESLDPPHGVLELTDPAVLMKEAARRLRLKARLARMPRRVK